MELKDGIKTFHAKSKNEWRNWLANNHLAETSVWLIIYRKESKVNSVYYPEAVDEALCFGWIDSKPNKRDDESYYQFFSKRNPKSNWSAVNKVKVEKLLQQGLMAQAGLNAIEIAKENGTWNALDKISNLELTTDLQQAFDNNPQAFSNWQNFPPSAKRGILEWIINAKQNANKQKRIAETVALAEKNVRSNQYNNKKLS